MQGLTRGRGLGGAYDHIKALESSLIPTLKESLYWRLLWRTLAGCYANFHNEIRRMYMYVGRFFSLPVGKPGTPTPSPNLWSFDLWTAIELSKFWELCCSANWSKFNHLLIYSNVVTRKLHQLDTHVGGPWAIDSLIAEYCQVLSWC